MKTPNLNKFLVTRSPEVAMFAESCGVEVIFVDLETVGKADRQKNQGTPINSHSVEDAAKIKKKLKHAQLLTRINPLYKGSRTEIESVIDAGSDIIMIPFFSHPDDLKPILEIIDGRAKVSLLFETPLSIFRFNHFLDELKFDEVHFGLNDLRILSGLDFLFETVSGGVLESAIAELRKREIPFGIGGIGRAQKSLVSPVDILSEHARLGSTRVILSRAFAGEITSLKELTSHINLQKEIQIINDAFEAAHSRNIDQVLQDQKNFRDLIYKVSSEIRTQNQNTNLGVLHSTLESSKT